MALNDIFDKIQQYTGVGDTSNAEQEFDRTAQNAPKQEVAGGLSNLFRSGQTPPFPQLISQLFSNSDGPQRAGILSHLMQAAGPAVASGMLGNLFGGGTPSNAQVTPEQAQQVSPEAVHDLAQHAEKNDPSIIDRASDFYAQHPTLVKSLGAGALAMIMSHMSSRK